MTGMEKCGFLIGSVDRGDRSVVKSVRKTERKRSTQQKGSRDNNCPIGQVEWGKWVCEGPFQLKRMK